MTLAATALTLEELRRGGYCFFTGWELMGDG